VKKHHWVFVSLRFKTSYLSHLKTREDGPLRFIETAGTKQSVTQHHITEELILHNPANTKTIAT
jgi:hypothetical protein